MFDIYRDDPDYLKYLGSVRDKNIYSSMIEESIIWKSDIVAIKIIKEEVIEICYNYFHCKFHTKKHKFEEGH